MFNGKKETVRSDSLPSKQIKVSSVDLRNGQQSLFATRFKTEDMLPVLDQMDSAGFLHIEVWGGATFDTCIRFLNDDPWDRLKLFKQHLTNTPTRMLLRGQNLLGYTQYPDDIVERFVYMAAACGMDVFLVFDGLNDVRNCEMAIKAAKAAGKEAHGAILYTVSPVHDTKSFVKTAKQFEKLGVDAIHLIDMAGQMTPTAAYNTIKALKESINVPLHIKCHTTGGMADIAYWEAIRAGVDAVSTCFSAMANGTSNPAVEPLVAALAQTPADTGLNLDQLQQINTYFVGMREKYKEYLSKFTGVDIGVLRHQVPGGMISNLESQLKAMGQSDLIEKVFAEVQNVRRDLGYPPLATPFSQMVGAQSTSNIISGERYKTVFKEVKDYIYGKYGETPGKINEELARKVLGNDKPINTRPGSLLPYSYNEIREKCKAFARTEEDILTYALFPQAGEAFLKQKYDIK